MIIQIILFCFIISLITWVRAKYMSNNYNKQIENMMEVPKNITNCYASRMFEPTYSNKPEFNYERIYPTSFYDPKYNPWPRFDKITYS
jgi:hypothetical protein